MNKGYFHGEVVIVQAKKIPDGAKKVSPINGSYILADSEVTGNHHLLEAKEDVTLYEKDGVLYMRNDSPAKVFCAIKDRHDVEVLPPGIWEIDRAQEYDHLKEEVRVVSD